jgi:hypothetical protein
MGSGIPLYLNLSLIKTIRIPFLPEFQIQKSLRLSASAGDFPNSLTVFRLITSIPRPPSRLGS